MKYPNECLVLSSIYNIKLDCCKGNRKLVYPSYVDKDTPQGCLIAHITLTLLEFERIKNKIINNFELNFKRLTKLKKFKKEDILEIIRYTLILHDIGKLSENYVEDKRYRHEIASAILSFLMLEKNPLITVSVLRYLIPTAILLHHESYQWRILEETLSEIDIIGYFRKALGWKRGPYSNMKFKQDKLLTNIKWLKEILEKIGLLTKNVDLLLEDIKKIQRMSKNSEKVVLLINKMENLTPKLLRLVLQLYYIIYITDNRAASAREEYWIYSWKENWNRTMKTIRNREELMSSFLNNYRKKVKFITYISTLSLIPNSIKGDNSGYD